MKREHSSISKYHERLIGKRIRLQFTNDPYTKLNAGSEGVVTFVDDFGTITAKWDDGSTLGINPEFGDRYVVIGDN
jgi:hypothetical protein